MPRLNGKPACISCARVLDGFTPLHIDSSPSNGDLTVCTYCGELQQFVITEGGNVSYTAASLEALDELEVSDEISQTRALLRARGGCGDRDRALASDLVSQPR